MTSTTLVSSPSPPNVAPGDSKGLLDGKPVASTLRRVNNSLEVTCAGITAAFGALSNGKAIPLDSDGNLVVQPGMKLSFRDSGSSPQKKVDLWLYSTPTHLVSDNADQSGSFVTQVEIPFNTPKGNHRLVVASANESGGQVVIGLGIKVENRMKENSTSKILIVIPVVFAVSIGLAIPTTAVRRRKRRRAS